MAYTQLSYASVEDKNGLHFLRDPLECEELGVSVIDVEDGRDGVEHDHAEDGQEEVYLLMDGQAELTVDDDTMTLAAGDTARVDPEATRRVDLIGDSRMVVVGAP